MTWWSDSGHDSLYVQGSHDGGFFYAWTKVCEGFPREFLLTSCTRSL
ncbi:hypothetical protein Mal52_04850 [Symmachiella dynata]|uniref:Uncharacterized protein n=1 Tax=Symmachiella dynata TaxID=2527995 RepID=A0A517ZHT4_9PLAN|nr:hypothetical protein Mal52_04850 [Symmachiella dynata]